MEKIPVLVYSALFYRFESGFTKKKKKKKTLICKIMYSDVKNKQKMKWYLRRTKNNRAKWCDDN